MIELGLAARKIRESQSLSQREAAKLLGISNVHLCNIEANKSIPSASILDRYRDLWNVDLYILSWCMSGKNESLPSSIQTAMSKLADIWIEELINKKVLPNDFRENRFCSTFKS